MTIFSVMGDLFFSFIKRKNGIKDYSNIFPGHGGLLDRADGLIFVIIVAYSLKIANVY
jgi:phosphatidate cytidylyltransferase